MRLVENAVHKVRPLCTLDRSAVKRKPGEARVAATEAMRFNIRSREQILSLEIYDYIS